MADYPILFTLRHVVRGPSFEAIVTANGRTVINFDEGEWWCNGVEPGGLIEAGDGPSVAFERFAAGFRRTLDDICEGCRDLAAFQQEAGMFFKTDAAAEADWVAALSRIAGGSEIEEPFKKLPRKIWTESSLKIESIETLKFKPMAAVEQEVRALPLAA